MPGYCLLQAPQLYIFKPVAFVTGLFYACELNRVMRKQPSGFHFLNQVKKILPGLAWLCFCFSPFFRPEEQ